MSGLRGGFQARGESVVTFGAIIDYICINAIVTRPMASITIRNLEEPLKSRLRIRAATHGRSMEDEARDILRNALNREPVRPGDLASAIRARFAPLGGVELPETTREAIRVPPEFEE